MMTKIPHSTPAALSVKIAPTQKLPHRRGGAANSLTGICPSADADGAEASPKLWRLRRFSIP
ncbi:MAG: hypothetical protein HDT46_09835 [Ruminococcaceae bacterium]|nr:hypothetical protein [Oscillospiraceae bacterium]